MKKININEIISKTREFDCQDLLINYFNKHTYLFWSWGPDMYTIVDMKCLSFNVNGNTHSGKVYIVLNFLDLFDVYLTTNEGYIKKELNNLYIDQLFEVMDNHIENTKFHLN